MNLRDAIKFVSNEEKVTLCFVKSGASLEERMNCDTTTYKTKSDIPEDLLDKQVLVPYYSCNTFEIIK